MLPPFPSSSPHPSPHSFLFPAKLAGNGGNSRPVFEIDSHSRLFYSRLFQHEKGYIPAIRRHSWPHFEILSHSRPFCSRPLHKGSGKYVPPPFALPLNTDNFVNRKNQWDHLTHVLFVKHKFYSKDAPQLQTIFRLQRIVT